MVIQDHYLRTFANNWERRHQQSMSLVAKYGQVINFEGKEHVFNDVGSIEWKKRTERLAKTVGQTYDTARRKISRQLFSAHTFFDINDPTLLGQLGTPDSELIQNLDAAWQRKLDEEFITALKATVYGGVDPLVTPITFDSNQTIAANYVASGSPANSGMTREKLQRALRLFRENEYISGMTQPGEELFVMMSPQHADELYNQATSRSHDNASKGIIAWYEGGCTGKVLGFETVLSNMVNVNGSDIASVMCWARSAMRIAPNKSNIKHSERPDLEHADQISGYAELGFMRRWEDGVVEILCDNSP